ncbi:hypothetical protein EDD29_9005 [Actinocorallia herbida]|uniref:ABC-2 family transporter n=1 Tax=Actinocorallia herbida TaxID=58109 RepID=A0A3N1DCK7_9ACTN|nr:ABC transporter permease subunit [Actinocorallia herbida]ROO91252.1 hypothetical protein EDD29_9005 [Actinocorallia herbida]
MPSARGVLLVAGLDTRARMRSVRWRWLLALWTAGVGLTAFVLHRALAGEIDAADLDRAFSGTLLFLVLLPVLCAASALGARSVNGKHKRDTLALLQLTRLTPADLALGKLLASWGSGVLLLSLTAPFLARPLVQDGFGGLRALVSFGSSALLIGVVCAIGQFFSAVAARTVTAVLLSCLTVFGLVFGTLIAYWPTSAFRPLTPGDPGDQDDGGAWWLLAANPFVTVADAVPKEKSRMLCVPAGPGLSIDRCAQQEPDLDLLAMISFDVRDLAADEVIYDAYSEAASADEGTPGGEGLKPVWHYGLGFDLVLAAGAVALTVRRLRLPMRDPAPRTRLP